MVIWYVSKWFYLYDKLSYFKAQTVVWMFAGNSIDSL